MSTTMTTVTSWLTRLALICFVYFSPNADGSMITFTNSVNSIKPLFSSNLTLRCGLQDTSPGGSIVGRSLTGERERTETDLHDLDEETLSERSLTQTAENMGFVTSIMISRDGVDLATINEHFPAKQVGGASGCQVSGHIPGTSGDKGQLELFCPHPTQTEGGSYRCTITSLSNQGKSFTFSQSLDVTVEDLTLKDLVSIIYQMTLDKEKSDIKIASQTKELLDQSNGIQNMNTIIANQAKIIDNLTKSDEKLRTDNSALNHSLDDLKTIASVFFSASLASPKRLSDHQVVVYSAVHANEGGAYNSRTGTFTVPIDGFYHLEVHAYSTSGKNAYLQVCRNGKDFLSITNNVGAGDSFPSASNSVTLRLSKGDTINVRSLGTSSLYSDDSGHLSSNTFNGHLVSIG